MRKNKRKSYRPIYALGFILFFSFLTLWWINGIQPVNSKSSDLKKFSIEQGSGVRDIADNLARENFIRSRFIFLTVLKILRIDNSLQAGEFELSPSMNALTIARTLTRSTTDIRVTFPEGKRAEEIAEIIVKYIPGINTETAISQLTLHQGYLFPDTYNFEKDSSIGEIIKVMRENFNKKYSTLNPDTGYTQDEIVIIASMIEREARHSEDRPLVASVIYNRLNIGMKLDIDATVQYALGYNQTQKNWWKKGLTGDDLTIDSPFNTYTNPGLPPQPISNPGLASLEAAANPSDTDYFFYFTDKNGLNHYANSLEEQNANINKYGL